MKILKRMLSAFLAAVTILNASQIGTVTACAVTELQEIEFGKLMEHSGYGSPCYYFFDDKNNASFGEYEISFSSSYDVTCIDIGLMSVKTDYSTSEYYPENRKYSFSMPSSATKIDVNTDNFTYKESTFDGKAESSDGKIFDVYEPSYNEMDEFRTVSGYGNGEILVSLSEKDLDTAEKDAPYIYPYTIGTNNIYAFYIQVVCMDAKGGGEEAYDPKFSIEVNRRSSDNTSNKASASKNISTLKFSEISKKTYTGENRKASVTIKDGDYTLVKGTDYTLTYKNCKNIGTASVTIKGKGKYTGTKTLTYKIVPKKTTLAADKKSSSKVKLSWTAVDGAEKYQIYYSADGGNSYKKLATVSGDKTSCTVKKLDFENNDYKFKIRSYKKVDGTKYYSSFSKVVTVK